MPPVTTRITPRSFETSKVESEPRTPQPGRPVRQSPSPLVLDELRPGSRLDGCAQNTVGQPPALGGIWGEAPRVPSRKAGSWDATPRCPQIAPFSLRASFLFFFLSPSHLLTPPPCTRAPPTHTPGKGQGRVLRGCRPQDLLQ